jgi:transcriptional regulator with XRE-family HTH domain
MSTIATKYFDNFGAALSYVMSRIEMSQSELADKIGVDKSQVSRWCNKKSAPQKRTLGIIANSIGYDFHIADNGQWYATPSVSLNSLVSESSLDYKRKELQVPTEGPTGADVLLLLQHIESSSRIAQDILSKMLIRLKE